MDDQKSQNGKPSPGTDSTSSTNSRQGGTNPNKKSNQTKTKSEGGTKFTGHDQNEMKGVIMKGDSSAQDYKIFKRRLQTLGGSKYVPEVGLSIKHMKVATRVNFAPAPLDESEWMEEFKSEDGKVTMVENAAKKGMAQQMYQEDLKQKVKEYSVYQRDMKKIYAVALGQIDDEMMDMLEGHDDWQSVDTKQCIVGLLTIIRDVCYQGSKTKVHGETNLLRAMRKLLCTRQRTNNATEFGKSVTDAYDVIKSLGGSLITKGFVLAYLEQEPIIIDETQVTTHKEYLALDDTKRKEADRLIEQSLLATLMIEGSDEDTSTLKETLANQYSLGSNHYPRTVSRAIDMLQQFNGSRKASHRKGKSPNNPRQSTSGKLDGGDKESTTFVTKGTTTTTTAPKDKATESPANSKPPSNTTATPDKPPKQLTSKQLLMVAANNDEDFGDTYHSFFQLGVVHTQSATQIMASSHTAPILTYSATTTRNGAPCKSPVSPRSLVSLNRHADSTNGWSPTNAALTTCAPTDAPYASTAESYPTFWSPAPAVLLSRSANAPPINRAPSTPANPAFLSPQTSHVPYALPTRLVSEYPFVPPETAGVEQMVPPASTPIPPGPPLFFSSSAPNGLHSTNPRSGGMTMTKPRSGGVTMTKPRSGGVTFRYSSPVEVLFAQNRGGVNPNWILLDSESSVNLICNRNMVKNIRTAEGKNNMMTIHCNSGTATTDQIADLPGFGQVWFYEKGIANVLSLARVTDRYRVTMDSAVDNALHVHKGNGETRRFGRSACNLYYCDMTKENSVLLAITTVEGQKKLYSDLDRRRAEKARKLQEQLWLPNTSSLIKMIDNNLTKNCTVTRRDVQIMKDIYREHDGVLKGKTVRTQPGHVREDILPVPDKILNVYGNVTLCIDIMWVNGMAFFHSISLHLRIRSARAIADTKKPTILNCIETLAGQYASRGFSVVEVRGDNDFECMRDDLLRLTPPIRLTCVSAKAHEPTVERSIRTVKENIRAMMSSLPVKKLL